MLITKPEIDRYQEEQQFFFKKPNECEKKEQTNESDLVLKITGTLCDF